MHNDQVQALMSRGRAGDVEAFGQIVLHFQGPLSRYLLHVVGDTSLAEDLTQDTFIELFESLRPGAVEVRQVEAWLYRVATNNALSVLRRRGRFAWLSLDRVQQWLGLEATLPHVDSAPAIIERQMVREALAKLPRQHAACLLMHDSAGLRCAEIAEQQGISLDAAKQRLARARRAFIKAYGRSNIHAERDLEDVENPGLASGGGSRQI